MPEPVVNICLVAAASIALFSGANLVSFKKESNCSLDVKKKPLPGPLIPALWKVPAVKKDLGKYLGNSVNTKFLNFTTSASFF